MARGTMDIGSMATGSGSAEAPRYLDLPNPREVSAGEVATMEKEITSSLSKIYGLVPARDNVIVRQIELLPPKSAGGIHIPTKASDKFPKMGLVLFCGPGAFVHETGKYLPMSCKAGDRIIFDRLAGHDVCVNGEMLLVINDESVVAVVAEEKTLLDLPDLDAAKRK